MEIAKVFEKKSCNFCGDEAKWDGRTVFGAWAYMCDLHFALYGVGTGLGRGQRLIVVTPEEEGEKGPLPREAS